MNITEKIEYDAAIGGNVKLDPEIITFRYAHEHLNEIKALTDSIENPTSTKLVFQKLPKHMRRRAMSHNPNRLPRKHRLAHINQMSKSGVPTSTKRPSRKYRRKPQNLLKEYQRRQRKNIWLETHIWHAKRFHMIERWGYKLANISCDKTFRSSYRASAKHCLIQDISYMSCIELVGSLDLLKNGLDQLRNADIRLGICAKTYVSGQREGTIDLFRSNQYPYGALGRVQFIWQKQQENEIFNRLWLFAHPSIYRDIVIELVKVFTLNRIELNEKCDGNSLPKYTNETTHIELIELKDQLNRFRLTGPLSQAILLNAFKPKTFVKNVDESWFSDFMINSNNAIAHQLQSTFWRNSQDIQSPAELTPNMIIGLNIEDPRINRPKKRTKSVAKIIEYTDGSNSTVACTIPNLNSQSDIWNQKVRERILTEKVSTHQICVYRNKNVLVPGERCEFENKLQPIPVLLIQRPGSMNRQRHGYGCGWDIIVPAGYGISTWMCLIMWGAKPGALRETETILREGCEDEFLPDTFAATVNDNLIETELRSIYFKKPPNKRQNYLKMSIVSPFKCPWNQLVAEWCSNTNKTNNLFYVLRNMETLQQINQCLQNQSKLATLNLSENCLIPVALTMTGRGCADKFSMICLPKKSDLRNNRKKLKSFEYDPVYSEPIKRDENEEQRKELRQKHLNILKRLRRRRVRAKRKQKEHSQRKVTILPPKTATLISEQLKQMRELWLPKTSMRIRNQCSREVFGYMTQCQFSFSEATVAGIGYVTTIGLQHLQKLYDKNSKSINVLVRDPNSLHYRLAKLRIRF